jgi:hypothetical protein
MILGPSSLLSITAIFVSEAPVRTPMDLRSLPNSSSCNSIRAKSLRLLERRPSNDREQRKSAGEDTGCDLESGLQGCGRHNNSIF